jgi:hypothetical protein
MCKLPWRFVAGLLDVAIGLVLFVLCGYIGLHVSVPYETNRLNIMPKNSLRPYEPTREQSVRLARIHLAAEAFWRELQLSTPSSAEQTLARRAIEEAAWRGCQAILLNEPTEGQTEADAFQLGLVIHVGAGKWARVGMKAGGGGFTRLPGAGS